MRGPGSAYGIIVTDALPANVTFVSANGGGTTNASTSQVVWNISSLSANTVSNLTLGMKAAAGGYATNIVSVVSSGG
jgi:Flp pilus assembly CpaE family ATPase